MSKVKWSEMKCGALWVNRDRATGDVKNFSGEIEMDGKKTRVLVMKRGSFPDDDPSKNYPSFNIYNADKLDEHRQASENEQGEKAPEVSSTEDETKANLV